MTSDELLSRYRVPVPRYTSYPTAPMWTETFGPEDFGRALQNASRRSNAPLSLYVHLPFCRSLCWYCGCNVFIARPGAIADEYLDTLRAELSLVAAKLQDRRQLTQVHLGGGTPTFLSCAQLERLWGDLTAHFEVDRSAEVSVEIHPSVTTQAQLRALRSFGFNRLSMGLQDFDPEVQRITNRIQTPEVTRRMVDAARALGFKAINFDLIYGLPGQNVERWDATLKQVLSMRPDRLAVYGFAFIPEVLKHQRRMPAELLPDGATRLRLLRMTEDAFLGAGYEAIGLDHFALPTDELAVAARDGRLSRNFQGYTVQSAADVVAVGSTGISDLGGAWAQNVRALPRHRERVHAGQFATERGIWLSDDDRRRRAIIVDLMCNLRASLQPGHFESEKRRLACFIEDGLATLEGDELRVTKDGRPFLRNVASTFDAYLSSGAGRFSKAV